MYLPQAAKVMMLPAVAVMRCVPLPSRALAHITSKGYITHEVYITFRESGTHRSPIKKHALRVLFYWRRWRDSPGVTVTPARTRTCRPSTGRSAFCQSKTVLFESLRTIHKKRRAHKKCTLLFWRRWRDSNSRTAVNSYTISSRAPSTGLGDISESTVCCLTANNIIPPFRKKVKSFFQKWRFLPSLGKK